MIEKIIGLLLFSMLIGFVLLTTGCTHLMVTPESAMKACDGKLKTYSHTLAKFECRGGEK